MITVSIKPHGFTVVGHANYDVHGKDIVCSAVSTLAQTVAYMLEGEYGASIAIKSGYVDVETKEQPTHQEEVEKEMLLYTFEFGISQLYQQYPQYIKFKEDDSDDES